MWGRTGWHVEDEIMRYIEGFVCHLYDYSEIKDINMLRCRLFCAKKGDCHNVKLPPCQSLLKQHFLRANYQSKIWRLLQINFLFQLQKEMVGASQMGK